MKPQAFSVSVNYRRSEEGNRQSQLHSLMTNLLKGLTGSWPVSFLLREVFDSCDSYHAAVGALQASDLMAPTYITVAGVLPGQGITITRARNMDLDTLPLWTLGDHGPVVQANMDHFLDPKNAKNNWQDICDSRKRRRAARKAIDTVGAAITPGFLWALLSKPPCLAPDTVYTVAMQAATGYYVTRPANKVYD